MRRWLAVTLVLLVPVGGCSSATRSGPSSSTAPSTNRTDTDTEACGYVRSWAKDPMTFDQFNALVASAGSARDRPLRREGTSLKAVVPSHSAEAIGNVLDEMVHTCINLGLFTTAAAPGG